MKAMTTHHGRMLSALAVLALGVNLAQADESHWVPASACEVMDNAYTSQLLYTTSITNKSTTKSLRLTCPLLPNDDIYTGYDYMDVTVKATKKTTEGMTCIVENRNISNTGGTISAQTLSTVGDTTFEFYSVPIFPNPVHAVRCAIPKAGSSSASTRSTLNSYNFYEYSY